MNRLYSLLLCSVLLASATDFFAQEPLFVPQRVLNTAQKATQLYGGIYAGLYGCCTGFAVYTGLVAPSIHNREENLKSSHARKVFKTFTSVTTEALCEMYPYVTRTIPKTLPSYCLFTMIYHCVKG